MNPYLRSKGANKHEFFKRLKDKLMGNPEEEEKLDTADKEQESDHSEPELEELNKPAAIEPADLKVPEQGEEASEMTIVKEIEVQADPSAEIEEGQPDVQELAVVEAEPLEEKKPSAWSITQKFKAGLEKHVIPLLQK